MADPKASPSSTDQNTWLKVFLSTEAREDVFNIWEFIAQNNIPAADRFFTAFTKTLKDLGTHPAIGQECFFTHPRLKGMRSWSIPRFLKYLVFYRQNNRRVEIVRVLHAARDIDTIFNR